MPAETPAATGWLLQKITGELQNAKMWPVKLANYKHQDSLSGLMKFRGFNKKVYRPHIDLSS